MDKSRRKPIKYDATKALIIKKLSAKHEVSPEFVRMALKGDRDSESALLIKKEYELAYSSMKEIEKSI